MVRRTQIRTKMSQIPNTDCTVGQLFTYEEDGPPDESDVCGAGWGLYDLAEVVEGGVAQVGAHQVPHSVPRLLTHLIRKQFLQCTGGSWHGLIRSRTRSGLKGRIISDPGG